VRFIRSASTVSGVALDATQLDRVKRELSPDRPIVCFFGFANPNKGVERLFNIADPARHHLLLLCDLDPANPYHASLPRKAREGPWAGHMTVTGFQPAQRVAECLAVAGGVVFPFVCGAGEWSASLQAAEASGVFSLATTDDESRYGYDTARNVCFCGSDDIPEMRASLLCYLGRRVVAQTTPPWNDIASAHEEVYRLVCHEASTE
jgi:glycosyltransferase involved in cell wall biosynthesis